MFPRGRGQLETMKEEGMTRAIEDKNGEKVVVRRSTIELLLVLLAGAGVGGGGVKAFMPSPSDAEHAAIQHSVDQIRTEGTLLSHSNDKRISSMETRFEYVEKTLRNIEDTQRTILRRLPAERSEETGKPGADGERKT